MVEKDKQGKAQGALLGTAIADALGWPFEFNSGNQNPRNIKDDKFISSFLSSPVVNVPSRTFLSMGKFPSSYCSPNFCNGLRESSSYVIFSDRG